MMAFVAAPLAHSLPSIWPPQVLKPAPASKLADSGRRACSQSDSLPLPQNPKQGDSNGGDDGNVGEGSDVENEGEPRNEAEKQLIGPIAYDYPPVADPSPELWNSIVQSCAEAGERKESPTPPCLVLVFVEPSQ